MFEKLSYQLASIDCTFGPSVFMAGTYKPGMDRRRSFRCWQALVPGGCDGFRRGARAERMIRKALKEFPGYGFRMELYGNARIYWIAETKAFMEADWLNRQQQPETPWDWKG